MTIQCTGTLTVDRFHCHAIKKIGRKPSSGKSQEIVILYRINKEDISPSLGGLCVSPESDRAQYENAMSVHICGAPIWQQQNSVNIWNLLWLSRRLITCTEQTGIYVSTFPNTLTSKNAQNHEISIHIFQQMRWSPCVTHRRHITHKFKMLWSPNQACY